MKITVFTPTYNRASKLDELFASLLAQSSMEFEWLVIDDGSTDNTQELFDSFKKCACFPVRYFYKENGGKHTAYNMALELAKGQWFMCLDSDDILTPDAIKLLTQKMTEGKVNGIVAYKKDRKDNYIGDFFPDKLENLYIYELGIRYHCGGDYVFAYETKLARKYPFPVFPGERFSPESLMLDMLGQECKLAVLPETLMICEYQPDGYSSDGRRLIRENPQAYTLCFLQRIDLMQGIVDRIKTATRYQCYRLLTHGKGQRYQGKHRVLVDCCLPLGMLFRAYYRLFCGF